MTSFRIILFLLLILYSFVLLYVEWRFGQPIARHFFTDINDIHRSPIPHFPFYGINTTLSAWTLWATALLFAVNLSITDSTRESTEKRFLISQIVFFTCFGFDDRFMVHESLYRGDVLLAGLGLIELYFLIFWGQLSIRPRQALIYLYAGAAWAIIMFGIDFLLPSRLPLRLAMEDLAKLWGTVCLFFFAWEILMAKISTLREAQEGLDAPTITYKPTKREML
jgi:hypothetical protein